LENANLHMIIQPRMPKSSIKHLLAVSRSNLKKKGLFLS